MRGDNKSPAFAFHWTPGSNPAAAPETPIHHYVFELYARDTGLDLPANTTRDAILKAMDRPVIGKAAWFGRFHAAL